MNEQKKTPFKDLGERLKNIRQHKNESTGEVSGAVEIDEDMLVRIEQGTERPTEDILLLLINHFNVQDDEADGLWDLAGYAPPEEACDHDSVHDHTTHNPNTQQQTKPTVMVLALDPRVIYSDDLNIQVNKGGVVMNFLQGAYSPQPIASARVGMSHQQAQMVLNTLQEALKPQVPKQLPPPTDKKIN